MAILPQSVKAVFDEAVEIAAPDERRAYLDRACADAPELRQKVEALLAAYEEAGSFLESPATPEGATLDQAPVAERPGTVIGPYKLLEQIGEGGMGAVWMAQQTEPVKRVVAIKLIKAGMDSKQIIARFEAERQALALMDHPSIAKVLDAGTTGEPSGVSRRVEDADATRRLTPLGSPGRPYFVMELVKGIAITQYCDEHHLTPRQRLELFIPVCQAVQHAHQKGIIHRDLKPSNVLVALYDGRPVPKVIDFGVAKATGVQLTDATLVTGFGNIVGTLEYMSPEQAEINQLDIDTRSDIYALGVLLYELLVGSPPFTRKELEKAGIVEMLRVIREEEPSKPSTKLSDMWSAERRARSADGKTANGKGASRSALRAQRFYELDWIVMKALEKDRSRRYETANGFAMDVQRYLADEPVMACPPSVGYRLRKLVRRNRVTVTAALVTLLVLVIGIAATTWALIEARWQRDQAQQQRLKAEANRREAHQAVHDYFTIVSESTLLDEPALEPLRKQLLQAALSYYQKFAQAHQDDPKLQAELVATHLRIGTLIYHMGPGEDWLPPIQNAVAVLEKLLRREVAPSDLECLKSGIDYGNAMRAFYVRDQAEALRTFVKAQSLWEELVRLDPKAPGFRNNLAQTHLAVGVLQDYGAVPPAERVRSVAAAVDIWRDLVREEPSNPRHRAILVTSLRILGMDTAIAGEPARSAAVMQEARAVAAQLAADFPGVPGPLELLHCIVPEGIGAVQEHAGRLKEAEASYREMLANQEALQRAYPSVTRYQDGVIRAWRWLGWVLWGLGRREDAADAFRRMKLATEQGSEKDPDTQDVLAWLLATCPDTRLRDAPRALRLARQAVERVPRHGVYWTTLGAAHYAAGEYAAAIRCLEKGARFPNHSPSYPRFFLAMAHFQLGRKEEARQWYEQGVASLEQELRAVESIHLRDEARRLLGIKSK